MQTRRLVIFPSCLALAVLLLSPTSATAEGCESLISLKLPNATITVASQVNGGTFTPPGMEPITNLPPFCRVAVTLKPSYDSDINVEVWMPLEGWNGRYLGTGNGAYAGQVRYGSLAVGLNRGNAVANTDMGTAPPSGREGARHLNGHPERWIDFGYRSTHEMTLVANEIIRNFYGKAPDYSYFTGCSTGGMQSMQLAQKFPEDYDGILAGAPGILRTRQHIAFMWNYSIVLNNPASLLTPEMLALIHNAVLDACSTDRVGLKTDGFLADPPSCDWSPVTLVCKEGGPGDCLTPDQLDAVSKLYSGPINPRTGETIYPGFPRGSELEWAAFMPPVSEGVPYVGIFQWVFGPNWDWRTFDYDRDVAIMDVLAPFINHDNTDLSRFEDLGHKLIMFKGWQDTRQAAGSTVSYYEEVVKHIQRRTGHDFAKALQATQEFFRFFMVPGMPHCSGGDVPNTFDGLTALEDWVERGIAPEKLIAYHLAPPSRSRLHAGGYDMRKEKPATIRARPLCPYPDVASFRGGDPNSAESFVCPSRE